MAARPKNIPKDFRTFAHNLEHFMLEHEMKKSMSLWYVESWVDVSRSMRELEATHSKEDIRHVVETITGGPEAADNILAAIHEGLPTKPGMQVSASSALWEALAPYKGREHN